MIGKFCKSFNQLRNSGENGLKCILVYFKTIEKAEVYCIDGKVIIFNNLTSNIKDYEHYGSKIRNLIKENLGAKYGGVCIFENLQSLNYNDTFRNVKMLLLPENFDEEYEKFIKNNNKQFTLALDNYGLSRKHAVVPYLYCITNGSINFFSWALRNYAKYCVNINTIYSILKWEEKYSQISNKLSKGTITAYNGMHAIACMYSELEQIRQTKRANDSIMQFNTAQKKLLKENAMDLATQKLLSMFGKMSDVKRQNFIRKMSNIEDVETILTEMSHLCDVHFKWSRESLMEYLKNSEVCKCDIVYDKDDVVVIKVNDYETIKRLAKTTNWCISKNKRYWNDYVELKSNSTQFVIFNFNKEEDDELSIVGFTTRGNKGITNAHSFTNANLMRDGHERNAIPESFIPMNANGIYRVLRECKIPKSIYSVRGKLPFDWNRESFFTFLESIISGDNYDVLCDEDNKVCISANSMDVMKLFGKSVGSHNIHLFAQETFLFLDFNREPDDEEAFMTTSISKVKNSVEQANSMYDSSLNTTNVKFEDKLDEFGLPYDIIRRVDDKNTRFQRALSSFSINTIKNMLKDKEFVLNFKSTANCDTYYYIVDTILSQNTLCVLNAIYDSGVTLSELVNTNNLNEMVHLIYHRLVGYRDFIDHVPTEEDFESLHAGRIRNREKCAAIGFFEAFKKIVEHEPVDCLIKVSSRFGSYSVINGITEYAANMILNMKDKKFMSQVASVCCNNGMYGVIDRILTMTNDKSLIEYIKNNLPKYTDCFARHFVVAR